MRSKSLTFNWCDKSCNVSYFIYSFTSFWRISGCLIVYFTFSLLYEEEKKILKNLNMYTYVWTIAFILK